MGDNKPDREQMTTILAHFLAKETGITEAQARNLVSLVGTELLLPRPDETHNEASQANGGIANGGFIVRDPVLSEAKQRANGGIPRRLVVLSNRLGNIRDPAQAGGLAVGIADALAERGGLWLGASTEYQDSAAGDEPLIHLEHVGRIETAALTLPRQEYTLYHNGYASSVLWPLFRTFDEALAWGSRSAKYSSAARRASSGPAGTGLLAGGSSSSS